MSMAEADNLEFEAVGEISPAMDFTGARDARAGHAAERSRRLRKSIFTAFLTRPLAAVISFVSIPLFTKYLGAERYGLYEAIVALSLWLSLSNAGITTGLLNKLTDCNVAGDRLLARKYVSSIWFAMLAMVGLLCVATLFATPLIHWNWLFPSANASVRREVPRVVGVTAMLTFASLMLGIPASVYSAYQESDRNNYWDGASKVATIAGCFLVVSTPFGLLGVAMVMLAVPSIVRLVNTAYLFYFEKPWLRPAAALFDAKLLVSTFHEGVSIFVLQIATIGIFQSDKLIITKVLGSEANSGFSVVLRLYMMAYGVYALFLVPLWPAYGEASRRGDFSWVRRKLGQSILLGCGLMTTCGATLFFFGDPIIRRISRGEIHGVPRALVVAMTAGFVVRICGECQSIVLNAAGVLKPQMILMTTNAVLNIVAGVLLARKFGVVGVAWSFPLTAAMTSLWAYPILIRNHFATYVPTAPATASTSASAPDPR